MDVDRLIRKLEVNEATISAFFGGLVLVVVAILMVNYFGEEVTMVTNKQPDLEIEKFGYQDTVEVGQVSSTSVTTYTVQSGDSLWTIAQHQLGNGYAWIQIAQSNNLQAPYIIEPGQTVNLPDNIVTEVVGTNDTQDNSQIDKPGNYMTKRGDYLWAIAVRFYGNGYKWVEIWHANQSEIPNPDILKVGQLLELP